jgi:hypothetical protein
MGKVVEEANIFNLGHCRAAVHDDLPQIDESESFCWDIKAQFNFWRLFSSILLPRAMMPQKNTRLFARGQSNCKHFY